MNFKNLFKGLGLALALTLAFYSGAETQSANLQYVRYHNVSLPSSGDFPGQIGVLVDDNADPLVHIWNANDNAWEEVAGDAADLAIASATASGTLSVTGASTLSGAVTAEATLGVTGASTFTGLLTANGDVALGNNEDDTVTINAPQVRNVLREDFTFHGSASFEEDYSARVATDASQNIILLFNSDLGMIHYRHEQAFAGTFAPMATYGVLNLSGMTDVAENDGVDITFSGDPNEIDLFHETGSPDMYCEVSLTLADISATDSLYFGWMLKADYQDAGAWASSNTSALFVLSDNAGDLDIVTELNGGGSLNDDTGTTWADTESKVLRVEIGADAVAFYLDGVAVTQTNAVLDADDGDTFNCVAGFLQSAEGASVGATIDYVEIGLEQ